MICDLATLAYIILSQLLQAYYVPAELGGGSWSSSS